MGATFEDLNDPLGIQKFVGMYRKYSTNAALFFENKISNFYFFYNYLSDHSSKMVHLLWVHPLKVLMK